MDLTLGLLVVRATKKEGRPIESAFAPRATRDSLRVNRERRLVDGAGLEPAASALRTHELSNPNGRSVNALRPFLCTFCQRELPA